MLFNSFEFLIFLPVVFLSYWFIFDKNLKGQNFFLIVVSYFFYGWWDWRFLSLIFFSSIVDYLVGIGLSETDKPGKRKLLLWVSICVNIGFLGVFKYYNFFVDGLITAFAALNYQLDLNTMKVILPVGISFYTFQTMSYSIDVYRKKLKPTRDIIAFFAFVSFFPQLVAGPIERATNLLPQFYKRRHFNYSQATDGMRQILWGFFKKIVIADNCAVYVNDIFSNYTQHSGSTLLLGAVLFAFQIYCDFSGYSDIAIGTARLFGFDLMRNFAFPYFSRDIAEFWRRWHISLSTWFRDYLYIPLGGSRGTNFKKVRNVFIIFVVSGFWHGANWTFLFWGFLNALYFLPLLLRHRNRYNVDTVAQGRLFPNFRELRQILYTFSITLIAWIFFRSENIMSGFHYLHLMISTSLMTLPEIFPGRLLIIIIFFVAAEWIQREKAHALEINDLGISTKYRWGIYYTVLMIIFWFGGGQSEFIYFQF